MLFLCNISGVRVEGILRQSADVDEVEKRVHDYEQGTSIFFLELLEQGTSIIYLMHFSLCKKQSR